MTDKETMLAFFENKRMDATADYLRRGRHLAEVDIDELNARWIACFKDYAANFGTGHNHRPREDIESEMQVRGLQPPFESVAEEFAAVIAASKAQADRLLRDPVRLAQKEREITADLEAFQRSFKDAN